MNRAGTLVALTVVTAAAVVSGCKSPSKEPAKDDPGARATANGSGSAPGSAAPQAAPAASDPPPTGAAPALAWKDADGELLLASDGTTLSGPCDLKGSITPTEVSIGGAAPQAWNVIRRAGRQFSLERMDWVIEVSPQGDVVHARGGVKTPLGTVTGIDEKTLPWFAAFIVAAPMIQHEVSLSIGSTKLSVKGAADLRAWQIVHGTTKLATREREDPAALLITPPGGTAPAWDPRKVTVAPGTGKTFLVSVTRDDDAMKAAFAADTYVVTEANGALTYHAGEAKKETPLGALTMRTTCAAHDRAVAALVWAAFATPDGHAALFPKK